MPHRRRLRRLGPSPAATARPELVRVSFRVAGQPSGTVRSAPFKQKLNSRLLRSERKPLIEADGELIDGRILTLPDRVRICR